MISLLVAAALYFAIVNANPVKTAKSPAKGG
jgi:hypothetical protein